MTSQSAAGCPGGTRQLEDSGIRPTACYGMPPGDWEPTPLPEEQEKSADGSDDIIT